MSSRPMKLFAGAGDAANGEMGLATISSDCSEPMTPPSGSAPSSFSWLFSSIRGCTAGLWIRCSASARARAPKFTTAVAAGVMRSPVSVAARRVVSAARSRSASWACARTGSRSSANRQTAPSTRDASAARKGPEISRRGARSKVPPERRWQGHGALRRGPSGARGRSGVLDSTRIPTIGHRRPAECATAECASAGRRSRNVARRTHRWSGRPEVVSGLGGV